MAISTNYKKNSEPIPEGEYEVIIDGADVACTRGGTEYLSIPMHIRNDVEQDCKDRVLWHRMWRKKTPTADDAQTDGYSYKQFQSLSKAVSFPSGVQFTSIEDWLAQLNGRVCRATVEHDEYNGKVSARLKWANPTKTTGECKHQTDNGFVEVEDDDLPF